MTVEDDPMVMREFKKVTLSRIAQDIRRVGHTVMGIFPDHDTGAPGFFYTVGRHSKNLPELLMITTMSGPQGMDIMNAMAAAQGDTGFHQGQLIDLGGKWPVMIIDATDPVAKAEYTRLVHAFYGVDDYRVQQVLLPDKAGNFPPDCAAPWDKQPIFGEKPWTQRLSNT